MGQKTYKEFVANLKEAAYAATARSAEQSWYREKLTDTAKKQKTSPIAVSDKAHRDRMFNHHAKQLALAKTKNDTQAIAYHQEKLKKFN